MFNLLVKAVQGDNPAGEGVRDEPALWYRGPWEEPCGGKPDGAYYKYKEETEYYAGNWASWTGHCSCQSLEINKLIE